MRRGLRTAGVTALVLGVTALPAAATVIMQNFVEADLSATPACMVKVGGADASNASGLVSFDTGNAQNNNATDAVPLLNETFTIKGLKGDRLISSDAGAVRNDCDYPITVSMKVESQFGDAGYDGDWTQLAATVHLGTANGAAGTDFSNTANWLASPIHANSSSVTDDSVGTVTLAAGQSARIGWEVDAGTGATATSTDPAILRFTISGQP
jgi:hypothetical protein